MASQLYLYDCDRKVGIAIPGASAVIGRDSFLQCADKRISREHGIIKQSAGATESSIQITSTHANPIFIRTGDSVLNILTRDLTATLRPGDKFALLPDQYWFEIRLRTDGGGAESAVSTTAAVTNGTLRVRTMEEVNSAVSASDDAQQMRNSAGEKRKNPEEFEAESSKKSKPEQESVPEANNEVSSAAQSASSGESPVTVKPDPDAGPSSNQQPPPAAPVPSSVEVKKETADSTGPPPRPSCQFGIRCYRHTADHRAQFAHPSDSDYRRPVFPPAPDDAPHCPYGAGCYRRNPEHFREFQHPDSSEYKATVVPVSRQVPVAQQPQQQRRPRDRNTFARDLLVAAIVNPRLFGGGGGGSEDDEDDQGSLFDYEGDSDEYQPGDRESSDNEQEEDDDEGDASSDVDEE